MTDLLSVLPGVGIRKLHTK